MRLSACVLSGTIRPGHCNMYYLGMFDVWLVWMVGWHPGGVLASVEQQSGIYDGSVSGFTALLVTFHPLAVQEGLACMRWLRGCK